MSTFVVAGLDIGSTKTCGVIAEVVRPGDVWVGSEVQVAD